MGIRADLAAVLAAAVDVPVYDTIHDNVQVPCLIVYPSSDWLTPGGSYCAWEHRYTATILALRMDTDGALDELERLTMLALAADGLTGLGAKVDGAGQVRGEDVSGVLYVAADVNYIVND